MKTTARFAVLLGVIAAAFFAVLLASSVVHAQHTGTGMVLPSSGGGLDTAAGDARYLMLDASNDPLTGDLSITGNVLPGTDANLDLGSSTLSWDQLYVRYLMDQAGATRIDMPETDTMVFTSTESVTVGQDIGYRFDLTNNLSGVNDIHTVWYDSTPTALLTLMEDGELRFGWHGNVSTPNITSGSGYGIYFTNASVGISASGTETAALFTTSGIELSAVGPDFIWTASSGNYSAGNIAVFTAADASGEISVTTGTSHNTAVGVKLEKWCFNCDSSATEVGYITDGGDLQIDGAFLASAGSVGTPSISFLLDADTGMYSYGTNQLGFATAGVHRGGLEASGWSAEGPGGTNYTGFTAYQRVSGTPRNYISLYSAGPSYVASGGILPDGAALFSNGAAGLSITSTHASGEIRFYRGATPDKIVTIEATGILPGADNSFNLGSSTLSWADFFTKYISDQAGANRIALNEASYTSFATGQAATAGADVAYYFDVAGNYDNADSHTRWRDNGTTLLMELTGTGTLELGSGSASAPIFAYASDDRTGMFFPSTSAVAFSQQGVEMARFDSTGLLLDATGPNYLRTAASSSGALGIFSGADASAEVAVHIGTSDATGSGEYLASFCLDCDDTPNEVARVESDGDIQLDGDLTVDGGNVGIGGPATASMGLYLNPAINTTTGIGLALAGSVEGSSDADAMTITTTLDPPNGKPASGVYINPTIVKDAGETLSMYSAVYVTDPPTTGTGTITTAQGLYVAAITAGATGNFGIWSVSPIASESYIASLAEVRATTFLGGNGLQLNTVTKTTNYTATTSDYLILCDTTSGNVTITLPPAASGTTNGIVYTIKKTVAANNCIIDGDAAETIDGATTKTADAQYESLTIQSDDSGAWYITAIVGTWT